MKGIYFYLSFITLISCDTKENKTSSIPHQKIIESYHLDTAQIKYQYYQKFGFTDVCEHFRAILSQKSDINLSKKLPIDSIDLVLINKFSNKTDIIGGDNYNPVYGDRKAFQDIELAYYKQPTTEDLQISLNNGRYTVISDHEKSELQIFDETRNLLYIEVWKCY